MKPRTTVLIGLSLLVALSVASVLLTHEAGAAGSTLSTSAYGWLGMRRVLQSRRVDTELLDAPPASARPGVLVVVFPWQSLTFEEPFATARQHLYQGGTLLVGYSGDRTSPMETDALEGLGLSLQEGRPGPPLGLVAWRRYAGAVWSLSPCAPELEDLRGATVSALRRVPKMPEDGRCLFKNAAGREVVFEFPVGRGRVIVMPAEMLANGRLGEPGNADWLATLAGSLAGPWAFDEYHHGLVPTHVTADGDVHTERFMDLYLAQIAFIYVLAVLAVVLRFGPAWREPVVVSGSVTTFLVGLGAIHEKARHHADAAVALAARARDLDRRLTLEAAAEPQARKGPTEFLELARRVARTQWRRS